jgi:hypothetical protein
MLVLNYIVGEEYDVRSTKDRRRRVTRTTAEYRDEGGNVYRKSFECAPDTRPDVPRRARDHAELNALKYQ